MREDVWRAGRGLWSSSVGHFTLPPFVRRQRSFASLDPVSPSLTSQYCPLNRGYPHP